MPMVQIHPSQYLTQMQLHDLCMWYRLQDGASKFRGEDPHDAVTARIMQQRKKDTKHCKKDHVADHDALFSRMELGLTKKFLQFLQMN